MTEEDKTMERLVKVGEVADRLGFTKGTVYQMVYRGKIPHVKIGSALRFRLSEIDRWVQERDTTK